MEPIVIRPDRYRQFGPGEGSTFCLVTNPELSDRFTIEKSGEYASYMTVSLGPEDSFEALLEHAVPEPAHILAVSPLGFFQSPAPDRLGGRRKLVAMPCNSTPTPLEAVAHFLEVMERTDPHRQQAFADRFFELGQASDCLEVVDDTYGTHATFEHLNDSYEWNQQAGPIDWGGQQIAPSGELSVLPVEITQFSAELRLAVNGEIALRGQPVLHSGAPSYLREDQARIYARLAAVGDHAVIAGIRNGEIIDLRPTHPDARPAATMLEAMFAVDSRYRIIWEMGFGINTDLELRPGNCGMNEVYGATDGCLHWGVGLTPYTQYALIVICPGSRVLGRGGEVLVGPLQKPAMTRRKTAACPCIAT